VGGGAAGGGAGGGSGGGIGGGAGGGAGGGIGGGAGGGAGGGGGGGVVVNPDAGPPAALRFSPNAVTTAPGVCSPVAQLQVVDAKGDLTYLQAATQVTFSPGANLTMWMDAACTSSIGGQNRINMPPGSVVQDLYFQSASTLTRSVPASANGLTPATVLVTVRTPPSAINFVAATSLILVGDCVRYEVRTYDSGGVESPVSTDTPVTLSSFGSLLPTYSDAACTKAITQNNIPANTSSLVFYVRATVPQNGNNLNLTATALGMQTATTVNVNPLVRSGTLLLQAAAVNGAVTLSPPLTSMARALVLTQISANWSGAGSSRVRCTLTSTTTINCTRGATGEIVTVHWQTLEHRLLSVQRAQATCTVGVPTTTTTLPSAVTPAQTFLVGSAEVGTNGNFNGNDLSATRLASATQVTTDWGACTTTGNTVSLQVASMAGVNVSRGTLTNVTGLTAAVPANSVAPRDGGAFVNYSHVIAGATTECEAALRATDALGAVSFARGRGNVNCNSTAIAELNWEYVDFGPLARSQSLTTQLTNVLTSSVALTPAVDPARTLVLTGHNLGLNGLGETTPTTSLSGPSSALGLHTLVSDGGMLNIGRTNSAGDGQWTTWAVTFEP
jgi:hypothetical protein